MKICAVTGSFDPITIGHMDIIRKASRVFDEVVLLILDNPLKKYILDIEDRLTLCREATRGMQNVEVEYYDGYAVEYCQTHGICAMVRGIRNAEDYEYEKWLASENKKIGDIDTVYFYADSEYQHISSTNARQSLLVGDFGMIPVGSEIIQKIWGDKYGKCNKPNR